MRAAMDTAFGQQRQEAAAAQAQLQQQVAAAAARADTLQVPAPGVPVALVVHSSHSTFQLRQGGLATDVKHRAARARNGPVLRDRTRMRVTGWWADVCHCRRTYQQRKLARVPSSSVQQQQRRRGANISWCGLHSITRSLQLSQPI